MLSARGRAGKAVMSTGWDWKMPKKWYLTSSSPDNSQVLFDISTRIVLFLGRELPLLVLSLLHLYKDTLNLLLNKYLFN